MTQVDIHRVLCCLLFLLLQRLSSVLIPGADPVGGGGPGGQDPPIGALSNFIKREKTLRVCT